jgi:hypothetical protein
MFFFVSEKSVISSVQFHPKLNFPNILSYLPSLPNVAKTSLHITLTSNPNELHPSSDIDLELESEQATGCAGVEVTMVQESFLCIQRDPGV